MNLARLLPRRRKGIASALPEPQALDSTPLNIARLVVLDLETTGLNVQRANILSIGAVAVNRGAILMADQFERTVYNADHQANDATVLHEMAPSVIQQGQPATEALKDFLGYADTSVLLAFHAGFDEGMLKRALRKELDYQLQHRFLDIAEIAPMVFPAAAAECTSLDDWQRHFHLTNSERHNASADAQVTAEILLILLNRLAKQGTNTLAELNNRLSAWRRLNKVRSARL